MPSDALLTGLLHLGTQGRGSAARLSYVKFTLKGTDGTLTCEPVPRTQGTHIRSFYVERRAMSGVIASGLNPMLNLGGFTEFTFTFWKRISKVKVLGAGGADQFDVTQLGQPDFPSPENEYYQSALPSL